MADYTSSARSGHVINGKHTAPGHTVHYTDPQNQQHEATIEDLTPHGVAHLKTHDGTHHASVPHSATGGVHTWNHVPSA